MIAELIGIAREKNGWYGAPLPDCFQAVIQLAIDQQATPDKKVINAAPHGDINDLVELTQPQLVRVDKDGKFFLALLLRPDELGIDEVAAGFHAPNIGLKVLRRKGQKAKRPKAILIGF